MRAVHSLRPFSILAPPTFGRALPVVMAGLLLWGAASPPPVAASKLGPLSVSSDFGEPLRATVDIVDVRPDLRPTAAELASPQTYAELGVPFPRSLEGATVRLVSLPDDRWAVRVSSLHVVDETDFNLVLTLTTPAGRQLRRYRLAADPPAPAASAAQGAPAAPPAAPVAPAVIATPVIEPVREPAVPIVAASVAPSAPAPSTEPAPAEPIASAGPSSTSPEAGRAPGAAPAPAPTSAPAVAPARADAARAPSTVRADAAPGAARVTAQRGDTATSIARRVKPADVSDEQAVMALYRLNESAFGGSVHRLPEGAVLQVPDAVRMREIDAPSAARALRAQPFVAARSAPADARDRLRLAGGGTGRATSTHGGRGSGGATDAVALEAAMSEARSRVRDLESIVADLRKLLDLRESQIVAAQAELSSLRGGARAGDANPAPVLAGPIGAATATLIRTPPADALPAPTVAATPAAASELPIDPLVAGGALGALVLAGGLVWRRRRQARASAEPDTFGA
jgi:pilus assembly protein FimV